MQDPIYSKIESIPRPSLTAANGLVWLAAIGLWLSELALLLLRRWVPMSEALENAAYYLPFIVLPMAVCMLRRPGLSGAMRLNPLPLLPSLSTALLAVLSVFAASLLSSAWGAGLDALGLSRVGGYAQPETEQALAMAILIQAALPAVCEELLFRGFVLSAWESRGTWFALGVSAGLFALLHGNLYGLPAYALVGAIAGFVTFALDSVYAGMVYHTVYNAACLILPWLMSEGDAAAAEASGAAASPFSLALEALTLLSMMAMLMATLRLYARQRGSEPIPRIRRPLAARERATLWGTVLTMTASAILILALSAYAGGTP